MEPLDLESLDSFPEPDSFSELVESEASEVFLDDTSSWGSSVAGSLPSLPLP